MRKNMKLIGLAVSLTCCAGFINAQEAYEPQERQQQEKHLPRKVLNPEKVAIQMTEQMNKLLQLTDKQYKKIYKLNLKEQKSIFSRLCKIRMTIAHQWEKVPVCGEDVRQWVEANHQ